MTIRKYNRAYLPGDPLIRIHRDQCLCSQPSCGATRPHTTGYSIYVWKYSIYINLNKPKGCNAPF